MSKPVNAKKPRAPKAKKQQPTKEETLKLLQDGLNEVKQIVLDLKEDEAQLVGMTLKKIPELIKEALSQLAEDQQDIQDKYDEILNYKEGEN